jgi:hypothetical protein
MQRSVLVRATVVQIFEKSIVISTGRRSARLSARQLKFFDGERGVHEPEVGHTYDVELPERLASDEGFI